MSSKPFTFAPAGHTAGGQVLGCCFLLPSWFHSWTWSLKQISVTYSVCFHNIQVGDNIPAYFHICTSEITGRKGGTGGGGNLVGYNHSLTQGKCLCTSPRIHSRKTWAKLACRDNIIHFMDAKFNHLKLKNSCTPADPRPHISWTSTGRRMFSTFQACPWMEESKKNLSGI